MSALRAGLSRDSRATVEAALSTVRELLGMDAGFVAEFTGGRQTYRALDGDAASFGFELDQGPPADGTYCARMLSGRLPNVVADASADERVRDLEITRSAGIGSYVGVPLVFPDGSKGSLCCLSHEPDAALAERDLRYMHALARLVEDHLAQEELARRLRDGLHERVTQSEGELRVALAKLDASSAELVMRLSRAVDYRDDDTGAHTERVARSAERLARAAGLPGAVCESILLASPLHDAGKVAIADSVLLKPGPLTDEERRVIETHAEIGYELLRNSASEVLEVAARIAWTHHERFDGAGYPRGLAGETIPVEGRILAIADVYDALVNDRVYRPAHPHEEAIAIMREDDGHFDPYLLDVFIDRVVSRR